MSLRLLSLAFVASALATPFEETVRAVCNPCSPKGATGSNPPSIGPDLSTLYTDILASVKDIHFKERSAGPVEMRSDAFCCAETLDCVNVQNLNIAMCYDKFTTNFAFADRSFGSLTTGAYAQGGAEVNLLTGAYSKDGKEENIYEEDPARKPDMKTLSIPPQWTGTGVGSAIPPTAIVGSVATPSETSVQTTGIMSVGSSGQTGALSQSTAAGSKEGEAASPTATPGAAVHMAPSLVMMGFVAVFYAI